MQDTSIVPFIFHPIDLTHIIKKNEQGHLATSGHAGGRSMKNEKNNTAPKKAEQEHIEDILLELFVFSASLGFIGRLLIDADRAYDSILIGKIVDHYTGLISDGLTRIQGELH